MSTTRMSRHIEAPPHKVYQALVSARAVQRWMVPDGMTSDVHAFDAQEGGEYRISLTYRSKDAAGKSGAHTDTHHGRFVKLVPDRQVVMTSVFETTNPALQGEMTITFNLQAAGAGTDLHAVHENVPPGVPPQDNEMGWSMSLGKLAALVEDRD